jgi:ABC-2 type transport system ATP-binding protein
MSTLIQVNALTKTYGNQRGIKDVTFSVDEGDVFGFLGPNGAGKTTTMRILMGLLKPVSGSASIGGFDCWSQSTEVKRLVGYLPGEFTFDPGLTGAQILAYLGHLRGGVDQAYLKQLIERLNLDTSRKFRHYSSGNKRKIGLIQAFMHRPRLLLLDEPTSGLDPLNQQEFSRMVIEARGEGSTVFLSSHILTEVEQVCSRVGIIREGQLVRLGGLADLKDIKRHEVNITFADAVPAESFKKLDGVESVESLAADGHTLRLTVQGGLDAIIKLAAQYPVITLTSHEPSLEEVFMHYYEGDDSAVKEVSHVVQ